MEPNETNTAREETSDEALKSAFAAQSKQSSTQTATVAVVAIVVVALALMYVWASNSATPAPLSQPPQVVNPLGEVPAVVPPVESVETIEMDLGMPEIDSLDAEIVTLEAELEAELEAAFAE